MSISSLNYNIQSDFTRKALMSNENSLYKAIERLSSGLRYMESSDGPASYSILDRMKTILGVSQQGVINAQNGTSLLDTADAALSNIERIFTDLSVIAEDAANGVWTDEQRTVFNTQAQHLLGIADAISQSTNFLGSPLIDGSMEAMTLQIGVTNNDFDVITLQMPSMRTADLANNLTTSVGDPINLESQESALESLSNIKTMLTSVRNERAHIGALQNTMVSTVQQRNTMNDETQTTIATIGDADIAVEMEAYTNATARVQASQYMFSISLGSVGRLSQIIQSI